MREQEHSERELEKEREREREGEKEGERETGEVLFLKTNVPFLLHIKKSA